MDEFQEVIFITNRDDLVFDALNVQPFGFVRKAYLKEGLTPLIEKLIRHIKQINRTFVFKTHQNILQIPIKEIYYFESQQHNVTLYKKANSFTGFDSLSRIERELKPYSFVRIHSGYLVNCRHIFSIESKNVILDNNKVLPVSRHRLATVKQLFIKTWGIGRGYVSI